MLIDHYIWLWRAVIPDLDLAPGLKRTENHSGRKRVQYAEGCICCRLVRRPFALRYSTCSRSSRCERTQALVTCAYADCPSPIWFFPQNMAAQSRPSQRCGISLCIRHVQASYTTTMPESHQNAVDRKPLQRREPTEECPSCRRCEHSTTSRAQQQHFHARHLSQTKGRDAAGSIAMVLPCWIAPDSTSCPSTQLDAHLPFNVSYTRLATLSGARAG